MAVQGRQVKSGRQAFFCWFSQVLAIIVGSHCLPILVDAMLPGLGWSASDIVLAVKVITKVCIAFRDAGGAQEQYASTAAFLDAFARTLQRINTHAETISLATDGKELSADMISQMKLVYVEYVKFDTYLKKVEPGLSSASFASRIVARAKWAMKEINAKVDALKKAVITPMMFVTPLLAVETLSELRDIKSRLPDATLQEYALRENRIMLVKINEDLAHLKDSLDSYWWTRRWAMTSIEEDIKGLTLAVKNNSDILFKQHRRCAKCHCERRHQGSTRAGSRQPHHYLNSRDNYGITFGRPRIAHRHNDLGTSFKNWQR